MPLTYTGRLVRPGGSEHPSLIDIAVALSRQPRFAGHCRRWWSVLDHTLFCDDLARGTAAQLRLALLLHDAHEAITADIPTDVKSVDMRRQQDLLDCDIFGAFYPWGYKQYVTDWRSDVKSYDRRALVAEATVVGPPVPYERILELFGGTDQQAEDMNYLQVHLIGDTYLGLPPLRLSQEQHPAVKEFLRRMTELL